MSALSEYHQSLEDEAKACYDAKIAVLGQDPYCLCLSELKPIKDCQMQELPDLSYPDIYHYLLNVPGYSGKVLKPYQSLKAYKYFSAGWVRSVMVYTKDDKFVVTSTMTHEERPLDVWVICQSNGVVLSGHCTCMTDRVQACSHVGATLFAVDAWVRVRQETCALPLNCQTVLVKDEGSTPLTAASAEESNSFYRSLAQSGAKNVILSVIPEYCEQFKRSASLGLPAPLTDLYSDDNSKLSFPELLESCTYAFQDMILTPDQVRLVKAKTKGKMERKHWVRLCAGRILASAFKCVCRSDYTNPTQTLIMAVCYPEMLPVYTKATEWGCAHQSTAKVVYEQLHMCNHRQAVIRNDMGLIINPRYPYMGAAPDGCVSCACCGDGLVEIKCEVCATISMEDPSDTNVSCYTQDHTGALILKTDHAYYYQIQAQLHITEKNFCDLVVWRQGSVYMERITPNNDFWTNCVEESSKFYIHCVLPELLSKWFSRARQDADTICYCRKLAVGGLLKCHNDSCQIKMFHLNCLGMKKPRPNWQCLECQKVQRNKHCHP
ncbi:uncharacterized protein LOC117522039 [Thalassophryne amazonica]|uniref:uncharacterized protein LOC117522039 n=1 Tax=Thalassophryne amazonica TaxID=390379 RepID=UPI0014715ACD|nr:uncharacterized protein LOC117522039 [Thalassophryne amazonica]